MLRLPAPVVGFGAGIGGVPPVNRPSIELVFESERKPSVRPGAVEDPKLDGLVEGIAPFPPAVGKGLGCLAPEPLSKLGASLKPPDDAPGITEPSVAPKLPGLGLPNEPLFGRELPGLAPVLGDMPGGRMFPLFAEELLSPLLSPPCPAAGKTGSISVKVLRSSSVATMGWVLRLNEARISGVGAVRGNGPVPIRTITSSTKGRMSGGIGAPKSFPNRPAVNAASDSGGIWMVKTNFRVVGSIPQPDWTKLASRSISALLF